MRLLAGGRVLLHLREDVPDHLAAVVSHVQDLRPREEVVEVVLHLVVLGQAQQVTRLHRRQVRRSRWSDKYHLGRTCV